MAVEKLLASNGIDHEIQAHFRFISSIRNASGPHTHDFYEVFLIIRGRVIHCINGEKQILEENSLVFIRANDTHYYEQLTECDCQFFNLSFCKEVVDSIIEFLGDGFPKEHLLDPQLPPVILLSKHEKDYIYRKLDNLNLIPSSEKGLIRAAVLVLLVELFSKYIMDLKIVYSSKKPDWLNSVCAKMKEKENFVEGISALLRISGKTHAHLCRVFKKHLNTTPIGYINSLRMSYAENLLLNTDMEIIDVCMEVGFENVSYFYELFHKNYKTTPYKFRKKRFSSLFCSAN